MVFLKTHILLPAACVPANMGPEVHDLWNDVGGQARAAVQDVCERRAMLSLVRANAAGLEYRFKVITLVCMSFVDRRSRADEQWHNSVPPHPRPDRRPGAGRRRRLARETMKTSAEKGTRRTKRDWAAAAPFFAAAAALILASISLHKVVTLERVQREGSKKKEYDSVADEWVHQRVTESESDDDSVEAPTVRTPLQ